MSKIPLGKKGLFVAIDRDLYRRLREYCEKEKRSLNKQTEIILEAYFKQLDEKDKEAQR